jgi:hypothetical protein
MKSLWIYSSSTHVDDTSPLTDGQEAFWPEVVEEDLLSKDPSHLVSALAGHFFPLVIIVVQVDQANLLASPRQNLLAGGKGEVLLHDGATLTSIEAANRSTQSITKAKTAIGYLCIEGAE